MDDPDALGSHQPLAAGEELSPQELLELIRTQHEGTARDIYVDPARILVSWGVAWMLGFGAFYFASSRARWHFVPLWAAAVVLVTLSAVAIAGVVTQMARRGRGGHRSCARYCAPGSRPRPGGNLPAPCRSTTAVRSKSACRCRTCCSPA